jgi:hypothetical protein
MTYVPVVARDTKSQLTVARSATMEKKTIVAFTWKPIRY